MNEKQVQKVCESYLAGDDSVVIAEQFGIDKQKVLRILRQQGIPRRSRSEINQRRTAPISPEELTRLLDEAKLSIDEIAAHFGTSTATIVRRMRGLGLHSKKGHGSPMEKNYFWNGGRMTDVDGYILLKSPGHPYATKAGYVREHRLAMERALGRYLEPSEIVHHLDGNKQNNEPENLQVYKSNSEHFLEEHLSHPRDPKTGRFLPKQDHLHSLDHLELPAIQAASKTDALPLP